MKTRTQTRLNYTGQFIAITLLMIFAFSSVNAQDFNMSNGVQTTCSGNFYDSGGPFGNYTSGENFTLTFNPSVAGSKVKVVFSSFDVESNWDALYIYDGPDASSPLISSGNSTTNGGFPAGGWWGASLPGGAGGITASPGNASGSLTFQFRSDASVALTGWSAALSCVTPAIDVNMSNGSVTQCGGNFYDSGGPAGLYNNSENFTFTFTPSAAGNKMRAIFSSFNVESGWDALYIYDGPDVSSPLISSGSGPTNGGFPAGGWTGTGLPGGGAGITASAGNVSGALTFQFRSDASVNLSGWVAAMSCVAPAADVFMSNGSSTQCGGNFYDSGGPVNPYNVSENFTYTFTPSVAGQKVKALFSSFSTESNWDALYIYDGPNTSSPLISSGNSTTIGGFPAGGWWGTALPGGGTGIISSDVSGALTFQFRSDASVTLPGWVAAMSCVTAAPPVLPGENCTNAETIVCGSITSGSTVGYTSESTACNFFSSPGRWYKFTATNTQATVALCGSSYDTWVSGYSGTCSGLVCLAQNDDFCGLQSTISFPTTIGLDYYILVNGFSSNSGAFTMNLTCSSPPDPCNTITDIPNTCPNSPDQTFTLTGSSAYQSVSACFFTTPGQEKIFRYTPSVSGMATLNVSFTTSSSWIDYEWKPETSGCSSTGWTCIQDIISPTSVTFGPLVAGQSYLIMADGESTISLTHTFNISCPQPAPPNDVCTAVSPVTLTSGVPQVFTGTTVGATPDGPFFLPTVWEAFTINQCANVSVRFCGTAPPHGDTWINLATSCPGLAFITATSWAQDCGDGNWSVYFNDLPAGTYWFPVLGLEPPFNIAGPYSLTITAVSGTPAVGTATVTPSSGCGPTGLLTVDVSSFSGNLQWQFESPIGSGIWFNIGGATFTPISLTANLGVGQELASFGIRAAVGVCGNYVFSNAVSYVLNNPNPPTLPVGLSGCGSAVGNVSVTPNPLPNHTVRWYSASTGGILLGTGSSLPVNVTASTSYFAASFNSTTGCESSTRLQVNAIVNPQPSVTASSNSPVCSGSAINLSSVATVPITCGGIFTVTVSGSGFLDMVTWQLKSASNVVLGSGGPFGFGSTNVSNVTVSNADAPAIFFIETEGPFLDNTANYSIVCSGSTLASGTIGPGLNTTVPNLCCGAGAPAPSSSVNMSTTTVSSCDASFYDSGGPVGFYNSSEDFTLTFTPSAPGAMVKVVFNSFSTESGWDPLYIHNGPSTASPLVSSGNGGSTGGFPAGGWWGTTLPGGGTGITSTDPSGALTFHFRSDASVTMAGWSAVVSCIGGPPPPSPYTWNGPNSYFAIGQNTSLTATPAGEGDYTVTFTATSGCTATATAPVVVNVAPAVVSLQSATLNGGVATAFPSPPTFLDIPVFTETLTCDKVVNYNVLITGTPNPGEIVGGVTHTMTGATVVPSGTSGTGSGTNFTRLIPTGRTTVTVNATNVCGSQSKTFRVTVTDNVVPVITPIQVAATNTNGGECASLVQVTQPSLGNGLFDNCPNSSIVFVSRSDGRSQLEPYYAGTTTVTWMATDASANTGTATQNVVVNNFKPVITSFTTSSNVIFVGQKAKFTAQFTDEDGGGTHTVKFYRDKNDASPASIKVLAPLCTQSCLGTRNYTVSSDSILYSTSEVAEPKVEVLDGCNLAADQNPGVSTYMYLAIAVAGTQFTTEGGHFTMPAGGFPSAYEGMDISMGNVVKKATNGNSYKGQLEMNVHIPNLPDWRVHTDNGSNQDITWDYLTIGGCSLATFKGAVNLNGQSGYKVLVQQSDKDRNPATSNFIRVKVTTNSGTVVFDTQPGLTEALTGGNGGAAAIITALSGGAVKVQPASGCVSRIEDELTDGSIQNIPNPFTSQTEIRFNVPEDGKYTLTVYNYLGQQVATLFNAEAVTGSTYSVIFDGSNFDAGIYTYTLRSANVNETRRMNLIK